MKSLLMALLLSVCVPTGICFAEDKEKEKEPEEEYEIFLTIETSFQLPHTRSMYSGTPEAVLHGSCVSIVFNDAVPSAEVIVLDAGSGAVVCRAACAYEAEVEMDLSGFPKGQYIIRIETETAAYEGTFSL